MPNFVENGQVVSHCCLRTDGQTRNIITLYSDPQGVSGRKMKYSKEKPSKTFFNNE